MHRISLSVGLVLALSACENQAPGPAAFEITPVAPTTADELVLTVTTDAPDADGDSVTYEFQWTLDGELVQALAGQRTVPASQRRRAGLVGSGDRQ